MTAPIVCAGDGSEPFLAGGIPNLEFDVLVVDGGCLEPEIYANGGKVMLLELVFGKANKDGGFADTRIADDDSLVKMVELFNHLLCPDCLLSPKYKYNVPLFVKS